MKRSVAKVRVLDVEPGIFSNMLISNEPFSLLNEREREAISVQIIKDLDKAISASDATPVQKAELSVLLEQLISNDIQIFDNQERAISLTGALKEHAEQRATEAEQARRAVRDAHRAGRHGKSDQINEIISNLVATGLASREINTEMSFKLIAEIIQPEFDKIIAKSNYFAINGITRLPWKDDSCDAITKRIGKMRNELALDKT